MSVTLRRMPDSKPLPSTTRLLPLTCLHLYLDLHSNFEALFSICLARIYSQTSLSLCLVCCHSAPTVHSTRAACKPNSVQRLSERCVGLHCADLLQVTQARLSFAWRIQLRTLPNSKKTLTLVLESWQLVVQVLSLSFAFQIIHFSNHFREITLQPDLFLATQVTFSPSSAFSLVKFRNFLESDFFFWLPKNAFA